MSHTTRISSKERIMDTFDVLCDKQGLIWVLEFTFSLNLIGGADMSCGTTSLVKLSKTTANNDISRTTFCQPPSSHLPALPSSSPSSPFLFFLRLTQSLYFSLLTKTMSIYDGFWECIPNPLIIQVCFCFIFHFQ